MSALELKRRALDLRRSLYALAREHEAATAADYTAAARMLGEMSAELGRVVTFRDRARRERDELYNALERAQSERDKARAEASDYRTIADGLKRSRLALKADNASTRKAHARVQSEHDAMADKLATVCRERDALAERLSAERATLEQIERERDELYQCNVDARRILLRAVK